MTDFHRTHISDVLLEEMKASNFGVKSSDCKVMVEERMLETALKGAITSNIKHVVKQNNCTTVAAPISILL